MQVNNNSSSIPAKIVPKNKTTIILKNPKVNEVATANLKRSGDNFPEFSQKKLKLDSHKTPVENNNNVLPNIAKEFFAIKETIEGFDEPLENYKKAAEEILELKKQINLETLFSNISTEEKFQRIRLLLKIVHPFPISQEIFDHEAEIFRAIKNVCASIAKEVPSQNEETVKIRNSIVKNYYPLFCMDYATWRSPYVAEEIDELWIEYEASDQKEKLWETIIELYQGEIHRFSDAKKANLKNETLVTSCDQALAVCYERLADIYFDAKSDFSDTQKIEMLENTIRLYQDARGICSGDWKKAKELDYSILNARYELAICLKEASKTNESLKQISEIEKFLEKNFKNNILSSFNYELIFYRLAVLFERYDQQNVKDCREKAVACLNKFYQNSFLSTDKSGKALEVLGWLKHFTTLFKCQNIVTTPESLEDYAIHTDKKVQLLEGLKQLENDFSLNYGITLKSHQVDSYEKMAAHIQEQTELEGGYLHLPTGAGKTYIMLLHILATKMPTLILVPRTSLMNQTIENIKKISPNTRVSRYDGHAKDIFSGQIMVTTYQMLDRDFRTHKRIPLESFGLVYADEAHNALTGKQSELIRELQSRSFVIGLTATDYYNGKRSKEAYSNVKDVFGTKIHGVDLVSLIENGSLSPVKNVIVNAPEMSLKDFAKLKKNKEGDYSEKDLETILNRKKYNDVITDTYLNEYDPETGEKLFGKSLLCFCVGIDHSEVVAECLNDEISKIKGPGTWAAAVHSRMSSKKIEETIRLHKEGKILCLTGDKILTEGYDNPQDTVQFNIRPSRSVPLVVQRGGRMLRPHEDKKMALIFDWSYPEFDDQLLFNEILEGRRWVGIKEVKDAIVAEPRKTNNYTIDWSENQPVKKEKPSFSPPVERMMVEEKRIPSPYTYNSVQINNPVKSPINIFQTNVYQGQGMPSTQNFNPYSYGYPQSYPQHNEWNQQNPYPRPNYVPYTAREQNHPVYNTYQQQPAYNTYEVKQPVYNTYQQQQPAYNTYQQQQPVYNTYEEKQPAYNTYQQQQPAYNTYEEKPSVYTYEEKPLINDDFFADNSLFNDFRDDIYEEKKDNYDEFWDSF